ncbi:hypothetical protein OG2516_07627 [Oceanicola granulosus HTCC2516]|uniref:EF-hand domain-containing protein n=1 Tax=Oceanicola granulosus (strain ATCC BAA-861 / DSM 15982 / KCTC 12143 / HTCC2516) TaxID=314256 RepID=Q2CIC9_OCEGH|nr:hypothetical protein [Oceanicola granulosus]EAR52329.1 hypothetical protein OG2516_07627 [Oceanicola granulosus HTCC2516]
MTRTALSLFAIAAAGLAAPATAQDESAYCASAFYAADLDLDGLLNLDELTAARDGVFESLDANEDGSISRDEYVTCEQGGFDARLARTAGRLAEGGTEALDAMWSNIAGDEDTVSREDFMASAQAAYEGNRDAEDRAWSHPYLGAADDEDLSELSIEQFAASSAFTFETTDRDGNDVMSRDEWLARAEQLEVTADQINHRFDALDANADDALDADELGRRFIDVTGDAAEDATVPVFDYYFMRNAQ